MANLPAAGSVQAEIAIERSADEPIGCGAQHGITVSFSQDHTALQNEPGGVGLSCRVIGAVAESLAKALDECRRCGTDIDCCLWTSLPLARAHRAIGEFLQVSPELLHGRGNGGDDHGLKGGFR